MTWKDVIYLNLKIGKLKRLKTRISWLLPINKLEPGYQVARLRLLRGLTQAQLAEMIGTRRLSIARLENGTSASRLSFLTKIAEALGAKIEFKLIPETK